MLRVDLGDELLDLDEIVEARVLGGRVEHPLAEVRPVVMDLGGDESERVT